MNFYDFEAESIQGTVRSMAEYKDKVVVVVNTASKCGLTPQFEGLEALNKKYKEDGLIILGFPCNQFAKQEPGSEQDIQEFCQLNYGVSFPMFSKIDVNGDLAHPLFKYLKSKKGGWFGSAIKWNFTKFVIDKNGNPIKRFAPTTKPQDMEGLIQKLLSDSK
jgi:glutathione peroxidase